MSQASQSITVTRLRNGVSYSAMLTTNKGDLYQQYNATKVVPDFTVAANQPVVTFVCASTATTNAIPPTINIYWDGVLVSFPTLDDNMVNTAGAGLDPGTIQIFQKGDPDAGKPWKLKFLKNIGTASSTPLVGHVLKVEGVFAAGKVVAQKPFDLQPLVDSGYTVHIEAGTADMNPFVVDQNVANSQCTLVAAVYNAGEPVTSTGNMTFKWFRKDASQTTGWKEITGQNTDTLIVTANDVDAYAEYKVAVTINGSEVSDTQSVMDVGDPWYVAISIKNQDGNSATPEMNGDVSLYEERIFTASLESRVLGKTPPVIQSCFWLIMAVDGALLNTWTANTNSDGVANSTYNTTTLHIPATWLDSIGAQSVEVTAQVTY